jgi:hypothetical protein
MVKGQPLVSLNIGHPATAAGVSKMWACACARDRPVRRLFLDTVNRRFCRVGCRPRGRSPPEMLRDPPIVTTPIACVAPPAIWGRGGNATSVRRAALAKMRASRDNDQPGEGPRRRRHQPARPACQEEPAARPASLAPTETNGDAVSPAPLGRCALCGCRTSRRGARFRSRSPLQSCHRGYGSCAGDASSPWYQPAGDSSQSHSR